MKPVYLDYCASTPIDERVITLMNDHMRETWGNPSSNHRTGYQAANLLAQSRKTIANLIGVESRELTFTSGATEAINLVLRGFADAANLTPHVVASNAEHKAVLATLTQLEQRGLIEITWVPSTRSGVIDIEAFKEAFRPNTSLCVCMWVNNETGVINPVDEIGRIARANQCAYFCDATQALGKIADIRFADFADMACFSAHKFYGPKGVGALWVRRSKKHLINPLFTGGAQEEAMRAGTENVIGIAAMAYALEISEQDFDQDYERICSLRTLILARLSKSCDAYLSAADRAIPHCLNIILPGIDNQILNTRLRETCSISIGSACNSMRHEPSHVLLAMGVTEDIALNSIRISIGRVTHQHEIEIALTAIETACSKIL